MPRHRLTKRRDKRNLKARDYLEDPVFRPKQPGARQPMEWEISEDGEMQPIRYLYSPKDLEPYKLYRRLYREKRHVRKLLGSPFPFLELPTELRVEIYQYSLISFSSIDYRIECLSLHPDDKLAIGLLRTCKQVNDEGGQVFYGENHFRFWDKNDFCRVLNVFSKHNFNWLKELTMSVPFLGDGVWDVHDLLRHHDNDPRGSSTTSFTLCHFNTLANDSIRCLLGAVAGAPYLQKLNLIMPSGWIYGRYSDRPHDAKFFNQEDVWEDLANLLRSKISLNVTIVKLPHKLSIRSRNRLPQSQGRFMKAAKRRLGVWDFREVTIDDDVLWNPRSPWEIPNQSSEEDPDEWLRDLESMFGRLG